MIEQTEYRNGPAVALVTETLRLVAPLGFGPRILYFGSADGPNLLLEIAGEEGSGPGGNYYFRGGHRLWHAPEHLERTYQPDNDAPAVKLLPGESGFALRQETEAATGIGKTLRIRAAGPRTVSIEHELRNEGLWPVSCAPWALTMLRTGGRGVIPLLPKGEHPRDLLPEYALVPWPYTDFSSGGWSFAPGFIGLNTPDVSAPQKLGVTAYPGWLGYWLEGEAFVKAASYDSSALYPDSGSRAEVFSNGEMIELETLGALVTLQPGETARHCEHWTILPGLPEPVDEQVVHEQWLPAIEGWRERLSEA